MAIVAALPLGAATAKPAHPHAPQPECAAIIIPGIPPGASEGRTQAGYYKSQLGRLELHADVSGGIAENYGLTLVGRPLLKATKPWPRAVAACLKAKGMAKVAREADGCSGQRFKIIMTRAGTLQYLFLYGMTKPGPWRFCHADTAP